MITNSLARHLMAICFPDGTRVASGVSDAAASAPVLIWNASDGRTLHSIAIPNDENHRLLDGVIYMALSPCGAKLVTLGVRRIIVWNTLDGQFEVGNWVQMEDCRTSCKGRTLDRGEIVTTYVVVCDVVVEMFIVRFPVCLWNKSIGILDSVRVYHLCRACCLYL